MPPPGITGKIYPMPRPPFPDGRFPATSLGLVRRLAGTDGPGAWDDFCRRYQRPLLVFALLERRLPVHDAEDQVQSFFAWLLESPRLDRFDPALGRFRSYLLLLFKRHIRDVQASERAVKRGGGMKRVDAIDGRLEEYRAKGTDPAEAFAREWALATVREAIGDCERALEERGEAEARLWLRVRYRNPLEEGTERPSRTAAARRMKLPEARAAACDRRVKELLRAAFEDAVKADLSGTAPGSAAAAGLRELLDALGG